MRGDFSRGHKPDRQRGRDYRRVLLQQGRPLLDSDFNAQTDANEHLIRDLARALGGDNGSPDGGFLITAGPLLACFGSMEGVQKEGKDFKAHLDYQFRFGERLPSLYLSARNGGGSVTIRFRQRLELPPEGSTTPRYTRLRIWARALALPWARVGNGTKQALPGSPQHKEFLPYDIALPPGATELTLGFDETSSGNEAWIGLIEGGEAQPSAGLRFWVTRGRYLVDGSPVRLAEDGWFPEVSFPQALGFTPPKPEKGRYMAFLEAWERHVTPVEDPGLVELALGGTVDTCTRVEAVGQVKVARLEEQFPEVSNPAELQKAFAAARTSSARLQVTDSGFGGAENWLYRFEVHAVAEASAEVVLKWSRNNGAELHPVLEVDAGAQSVTLPLSADLQDGDLVEALSEGTELGDARDGRIKRGTGTPVSFIPPEKSVGELFQVRGVQTTAAGKELHLHPWGTSTGKVGEHLEKLRRWDGIFRTKVLSPSSEQLEDGLQVTLSGSGFRVGDYWQFAARRRTAAGTDSGGEPPHGPERLFVPLAWLSYSEENKPATIVERWLDEQFAPLGRLQAHALSYDGSRLYSSASSVQEALDELYQLQKEAIDRLFAGSRDWRMVLPSRDENDDAGPRINEAIRNLGTGGVVCLMGGTYWVKTPIDIAPSQSIEIRGFPKATVLVKGMQSPPNDAAISVATGASLTLRDVILAARDKGVRCLVHFAAESRSFQAQSCGLYLASREDGIALWSSPGSHALPSREDSPDGDFASMMIPDDRYPRMALRDCIVVAGWAVSVHNLFTLEMHDTLMLCAQGGVAASDVGSIDGRGLHIDTGLSEQAFQRWMEDLPELFERKARDYAWQNRFNQRDQGTALYAHSIHGGSLVDSSFLADMGIWLWFGRSLRLERNMILTGDTGIRMDGGIDVLLRELTLQGDGFGLHLPLLAERVDILDCEVSSYEKIAILLLRQYAESSTHTQSSYRTLDLAHVRIGRGRFTGRTGGIQLGPNALGSHGSGTPRAPVRSLDVHLFDNEVIVSSSYEPLLTGISVQEIRNANGERALSITDSRIQASVDGTGVAMGVRVCGAGIELRRNEVSASTKEVFPESQMPIAILFERSADFVIAENRVRGRGETSVEGIGLLYCKDCRASVIRNIIEATGSAINMWEVGDSILIGENDIVRGGVYLHAMRGVVFSDNDLRADPMRISNSSAGTVLRNRALNQLEIEGVQGEWLVRDNTASRIGITPEYEYSPGAGRNVERMWDARVHGNRCEKLWVGLIEPAFADMLDMASGAPHEKSIVQVTDNRVTGDLAVNRYSKMIVEQNVLGRRLFTVADGPHVFTQRNLITQGGET